MNYKQLLILKLSNITEWKNDREMIIPEDMVNWFNHINTCEFFGDGKYILRGYYENGNRRWEIECQNDQRHGKSFGWWENGNKYWEQEYQNNLKHGKSLGWWESGYKRWETKYQKGECIEIIK